jgi:hypothetical protein
MKMLKVLACLLLFSCATKIKDFEKYQKAPLMQTQFMPNPDAIYGKVPSATIFAFETSDVNAKSIGATAIAEGEIANLLISNKLVILKDRKNLGKLANEIKLHEIKGTGNSALMDSIDYAIEGEVANVGFSSQYYGAIYFPDGTLQRPARYEYTASVQGNVKIYELPSLNVIETIQFSGSATEVEEVKSEGISIGKFSLNSKSQAKNFDVNLAKIALKKALARSSASVKNVFAKTGYIMEKRILGDKSIFLISLGTNDGIRQETKVKIIQKYEELNVLTGKTEILQKQISTGKVANRNEETKVWIVVPKESANGIKLGDIAKVVY